MQEQTKQGSFNNCTARFKGESDPQVVDVFISTISVYKDVERISDEDAIKGFPLLLEEHTEIWWQGIKAKAEKWENVIPLLRNYYASAKPAFRIYMEIFDKNRKIMNQLMISSRRNEHCSPLQLLRKQ